MNTTNGILTLILIFLLNGLCYSQVLVQLDDVDGSYYDDDNNLIVPKFNIRHTSDAYIYHNNDLIFTEFTTGKFEHVIYQIFADRYFIITAYTPTEKATKPEFLIKREVIVIDTQSWEKLYYFDLKGSIITNIYALQDGIGINTVKPEDITRFEPIKIDKMR